ncbi:MAG: hypothetical protein ACRDLF_06200 [Solirubrobacteraceae bacterium]
MSEPTWAIYDRRHSQHYGSCYGCSSYPYQGFWLGLHSPEERVLNWAPGRDGTSRPPTSIPSEERAVRFLRPNSTPVSPDPYVGYEDPAEFASKAKELGRMNGAIWLPTDQALGEAAAPNRFIKNGAQVRIGVIAEKAYRAVVPAAQRVATAPARRAAQEARGEALRERTGRLVEQFGGVREEGAQRRQELAAEEGRLASLPRQAKGYFSSKATVGGIEGIVAGFDLVVLRNSFQHTAITSTWVMWATAGGVASLILVVNFGLGLLAAFCGSWLSARLRLRVTLATLVIGFVALAITFVLLMLFRNDATASLNAGLVARAHGRHHTVYPFVSLTWMGPAQLAGSITAAATAALWALEKPVREQRQVIATVIAAVQSIAAHAVRIEAEIIATLVEIESIAAKTFEIAADAEAARAEIELIRHTLPAQVYREEAMARSLTSLYEASYTAESRLFENGGVVRCATPTLWWPFRWFVPAVKDRRVGRRAQPSANGRKPATGFDPKFDLAS